MAIDRREEMRKALKEKTEYDYSHGGDSGMYSDIFKEVEGLQKWKCGEGQHIVDIIPYIAGDKDPQTKEGGTAHVLHIWVHQRIGVNQATFVCPAVNYKLPCPICDHREKLRSEDNYDDELVKSLYPKHRNIFNIVCYDGKEEAKGIQIWDVSDFFMGEKLRSISKMPDRGGKGGGYIYYADPDEGKSIKFERKGSGQQNTQFLGHQFVERDYVIDDSILDTAFQLDQIINVPTYEELEATFFGSEGKSEEAPPEEAPPEPEPPKPSKLLKRAGAAEEPPKEEKKTPTRINPTKTTVTGECPAGGTFGIDCEDLVECGKCRMWNDCSAEKDKIRAKEAEGKKPKERAPSQVNKTPPPTGRRGAITGKR